MASQEKTRSTGTRMMARLKPPGSRIPRNHVLFERLIPASILIMSLLMAALIIFAAGVLLGLIPFN